MTKEERISYLEDTCAAWSETVDKLKARVDGGNKNLAGTLVDAELSLRMHKHELHELTGK